MRSRSVKVNLYQEYLDNLLAHGITSASLHRKAIPPRLFRNAVRDLKINRERLIQWLRLYESREKICLWDAVVAGDVTPSDAIALLGMMGNIKQEAVKRKLGPDTVLALHLTSSLAADEIPSRPATPPDPSTIPPPESDLDQQVRTAFAEAAATIRGLKSDKGASGHLALHVYYANGKVKKVAREFGDQIDVDMADAFAKEQVTQGKLLDE